MSTHIGDACRAAGLLPIAMPFSVRNSTAPGPGRIRDFRHRLIGKVVGRQRRQGLPGRQPIELAQESQVGQSERGANEIDCRTEKKRPADAGPERGSGPAGRFRRRNTPPQGGAGQDQTQDKADEVVDVLRRGEPVDGWQVVNPDGNRQRYAERAAAKRCTRCGKNPPRPDRKTCEGCAAAAADRSARLRTRRKAAALCLDCGRPTTGGHVRCEDCRLEARQP